MGGWLPARYRSLPLTFASLLRGVTTTQVKELWSKTEYPGSVDASSVMTFNGVGGHDCTVVGVYQTFSSFSSAVTAFMVGVYQTFSSFSSVVTEFMVGVYQTFSSFSSAVTEFMVGVYQTYVLENAVDIGSFTCYH
jgi:hypothetical protein